jgi:hypothetical protein
MTDALDRAHDEVAMLLAQAVTRPDDAAICAAIYDRVPDDALVECPLCGRVGLVDRIVGVACPHQ